MVNGEWLSRHSFLQHVPMSHLAQHDDGRWRKCFKVTAEEHAWDGCRLSALEEMSGMEVLASDKTGTLTLNRCASVKMMTCLLFNVSV